MVNISKIRIFKPEHFPLLKIQPILEKVCIGTCRIAFQTADTVFQYRSVNHSRNHRSQRLMLIMLIGSLQKLLHLTAEGGILPVNPAQAEKFLIRHAARSSLCTLAQFFCHIGKGILLSHDPFGYRLFTLHQISLISAWKKSLHCINQIRRTERFAIAADPGIGQIQPLGRLRHIHV